MNLFRNMTLKWKMLACFALMIALNAALVCVAATRMMSLRESYDIVIAHPLTLESELLKFQSEFRDLRRIAAMLSTGAYRDLDGGGTLAGEARAAHGAGLEHLDGAKAAVLGNPALTREEKDARVRNNDLLRDLFNRYHGEVAAPLMSAALAHDRETIMAISRPAGDTGAAVREKIMEMLASATETARVQVGRAKSDAGGGIALLAAISAAAAVVAVAVSLSAAGGISRPLAPLTRFMRDMAAAGDTSVSPGDAGAMERFGRNRDEVGQLTAAAAALVGRINEIRGALERVAAGDLSAELRLLSGRDSMGLAFRRMMDNLNAMCGGIGTASLRVSTGAGQVTAGAQSLSSGAAEQAASIEQLSVAIAEMAERTDETALMAGKAADLAGSIQGSAEKSSRQMGDMMAAVGQISEASQSIRKIIKTIDEIAFQTNILAVNASVEAAHAGKYGKGFSVVAGEVRSLAAKSAAAAKETERLIADSMEKSGLGVLMAEEAAASLAEIVSGIHENNRLVSEIAGSSVEQSQNIAQINTGVCQVSQVVQQNSSTAEESASASEEMYGQAAMLRRLVSQFRLRGDPPAGRPLPEIGGPGVD